MHARRRPCSSASLRRSRAPVLVVALVVAAVVGAGCTAQEADDPDAAQELLFSPDPTQQATSTPPQPTTDPSPTLPPLPNDCQSVVRSSDVAAIVGVPLAGETTFVFADALPEIGRTGRVTCGYGDEGEGPRVEITINDYESADAASDRVDVTLEAATQRGRTITEQPVGPYDAYISAGPDSTSMIVDAGARTLVVTVEEGLVSEAAQPVVLERLATRALGLPTETVEP